MGYKILILAALGLGALYMMHLLAQDYNKIRKPAMKLARFFLTKRDLNAVLNTTPSDQQLENFVIDWDRILRNDHPLNCAVSLICQITAGAEQDNEEAKIISALVQYGRATGAPKAIENAYNFGMDARKNYKKCYQRYPYCPYSAKTMLKLLQVYSYFMDGSR